MEWLFAPSTLRPRSWRELLTLYNPRTYRSVKIVGYNTGVVHFGHRFPGKTVVSTAGCNQRLKLKGDVLEVDAGVTIRQATDFLARHHRELHVVPNYSYVCIGTGFFIPIHGSASKFSTVADTIEKVVLYDPREDRFVVAQRDEPEFARYVYNLRADVLLLRLTVRTKERSTYYVLKEELERPSSREILACLRDTLPANVEVRKAGSSAATVQVYRYFSDRAQGNGAALELPRDSIGRLWDRLEENPVTSFLFHALTRTLAHHVELFLSEAAFARFWETHASLPIHKIQLRFIRRDGWPHSPFRERDCISADLFMLKNRRASFERYLQQELPNVKLNPGKHSR
jgi:hypothetical protein